VNRGSKEKRGGGQAEAFMEPLLHLPSYRIFLQENDATSAQEGGGRKKEEKREERNGTPPPIKQRISWGGSHEGEGEKERKEDRWQYAAQRLPLPMIEGGRRGGKKNEATLGGDSNGERKEG